MTTQPCWPMRGDHSLEVRIILTSTAVNPGDPGAEHRPLDDRTYAIDHFPAKLLKLSDGFQTETGAKLAKERHERLSLFLSLFRDEI